MKLKNVIAENKNTLTGPDPNHKPLTLIFEPDFYIQLSLKPGIDTVEEVGEKLIGLGERLLGQSNIKKHCTSRGD